MLQTYQASSDLTGAEESSPKGSSVSLSVLGRLIRCLLATSTSTLADMVIKR